MTNQTDTPDRNPTEEQPTEEVVMSTLEEVVVPDTIAEILEMSDQGLPATHRCDSCGAQAYVQVEIAKPPAEASDLLPDPAENDKEELLFCVHHFHKKGENGRSSEDVLREKAIRIVDHRGFLVRQERMYKGQPV